MIVTDVVLDGVCQHEHLEVQFTPGVNGIVGPNGCGKTNLMRAVEWLITGSFPGFGTRERRIRSGSDKATGRLRFIHNGQEGEITRNLHVSRSSLKFGGGKPINSTEAVNAEMGRILGASSKLMGQYVFVEQSKINQILLARPAERLAAFQLLFGMDVCEKIRKSLAEELQIYIPASLAVSRDQLQARLTEQQTRLGDLEHQLQSAQTVLSSIDEPALRQEVVTATAAAEAVNHPQSGLKATQDRMAELNQSIAEARIQLAGLQEKRGQFVQAVADLEADVVRYKTQIEQKSQADQLEIRRQKVVQGLESVETDLKRRHEPVVEPDRDAVMDLHEAGELRPLEDQIRQYREFVTGFQKGACPTCGTTVIINSAGQQVNIPAKLQDYSQQLQVLEPQVKAVRGDLEAYRERRRRSMQEHAIWKAWYDQVLQRADHLRSELAAMPPVAVINAADAEQFLQLYQQLKQELERIEQQIQTLQSAMATFEAQQAHHQTNLASLQKLANDVRDVSQAQAKLARWSDAQTRSAGIKGQLEEIRRNVVDLQRQLREMEDLEAKSAAISHYRQLVSEAYGVLHRDNFPAAYSRNYFAMINDGWNQMLRLLDVRYSVRINDDSSINVIYPDGERYIEETSGGERGCASLAFLLTVNRLFAGDIGFMVLDEPTDGVDLEHQERVRDLFQEVQKYAATTGLQLLVVTHADKLRSGFSNVVDLA